MRKLSFCFGSSRQSLVWLPKEMTFEELCDKLREPIRTPETAAQYHKMKKAERDAIKDKGGFLAGTLKGTRRKGNEVISRSMITLDGDKLQVGFFDEYELFSRYKTVVYTTHTHMPDAPRGRILIPLTRDVSPEEYNAIARYLADEIGMAMIDPCSFKLNQMMYWPTASSDGEYICRLYEGDWLDPDAYLSEHPDWNSKDKRAHMHMYTRIGKRCASCPLVRKGKIMASEKYIEQKFAEAVKNTGGLALKFTSPGFDGMPDRIVLLPEGKAAFVEVKAPGKKPRLLQIKRHELLRRLGFKVYVLDGAEQIGGLIDDLRTS